MTPEVSSLLLLQLSPEWDHSRVLYSISNT
jgi:hypothetical protein